MFDFRLFYDELREELNKVATAFVTWGVGVLFMILYCLFLAWIQSTYGLFITIVGALLYLTLAFFFIDLWWNYHRAKHLNKMKDVG